LEKGLFQCHFDQGANLVLRCERPATYLLCHGTSSRILKYCMKGGGVIFMFPVRETFLITVKISCSLQCDLVHRPRNLSVTLGLSECQETRRPFYLKLGLLIQLCLAPNFCEYVSKIQCTEAAGLVAFSMLKTGYSIPF
jgi:hypothetical protein